MTGANYMGGKRSVARARSKDTTGKLQKRFFGTQRLNLLAGGLRGNKKRNLSPGNLSREEFISGIQLAHAKRGRVSYQTPPPPKVEPRNVPRLSIETRETITKIPRSKVLDALNMSHPTFSRSEMDRILALPDLVGLAEPRVVNFSRRKVHGSPIRKRLNDSDGKKLTSTDFESLNDLSESVAESRNRLSPVMDDVWSSAPPHQSPDVCAKLGSNVVDDFDIGGTPRHLVATDEQPYMTNDDQQFDIPLLGTHFDDLPASTLSSDFTSIDGQSQCGTPIPNPDRAGFLDSSSSSLGLFNPETPEPLLLLDVRVKVPPSDSVTQEPRPDIGNILPVSETLTSLDTPIGSPLAKYNTFVPSMSVLPPRKREVKAFNQHSISEDGDSSPNRSSGWNLFEEPNPWNTVSRILGFELPTSSMHGKGLEEELGKYPTHHRNGVGYVPSGPQFEVIPSYNSDIRGNNRICSNDQPCLEDLNGPSRPGNLPDALDILTKPEDVFDGDNTHRSDFAILSHSSSDCRMSNVEGDYGSVWVGGQAKSSCSGSPMQASTIATPGNNVLKTKSLNALQCDGYASNWYSSEGDLLHFDEAAAQGLTFCTVDDSDYTHAIPETVGASNSFDDGSHQGTWESQMCNIISLQSPSKHGRCGASLIQNVAVSDSVERLSQEIHTTVSNCERPPQDTAPGQIFTIELHPRCDRSDDTRAKASCGVFMEEGAVVGIPTSSHSHAVETIDHKEDQFLSLFSDSSSESDE